MLGLGAMMVAGGERPPELNNRPWSGSETGAFKGSSLNDAYPPSYDLGGRRARVTTTEGPSSWDAPLKGLSANGWQAAHVHYDPGSVYPNSGHSLYFRPDHGIRPFKAGAPGHVQRNLVSITMALNLSNTNGSLNIYNGAGTAVFTDTANTYKANNTYLFGFAYHKPTGCLRVYRQITIARDAKPGASYLLCSTQIDPGLDMTLNFVSERGNYWTVRGDIELTDLEY
jgi:hypothetical protein